MAGYLDISSLGVPRLNTHRQFCSYTLDGTKMKQKEQGRAMQGFFCIFFLCHLNIRMVKDCIDKDVVRYCIFRLDLITAVYVFTLEYRIR